MDAATTAVSRNSFSIKQDTKDIYLKVIELAEEREAWTDMVNVHGDATASLVAVPSAFDR